jgi:hypothetical protein
MAVVFLRDIETLWSADTFVCDIRFDRAGFIIHFSSSMGGGGGGAGTLYKAKIN